jgi:hypothetical protein
MFDVVEKVLLSNYSFKEKDEARKFFMSLQQLFIDWNNIKIDDPAFTVSRDEMIKRIEEVASV